MKVWVVMGNDFPHSAHATLEAAEKHVKALKDEDNPSKDGFYRRIYWRHYAFEVQQ